MSGTLGAQGALWILSLLVMRRLQPGDYGLIGIVQVFFAFCRTVQDAGLTAAIVQTPNLNRRLLNAAFWFFVAVGVLLTTAGILAAPLLAHMKGESRLPPVMRALSVVFIILGLRTVPMALLTRQLDFKRRTSAEISSAVIGSLTTLALAYSNFGVWSLVIGNLAMEASQGLAFWFYARWSPGIDCAWQELKRLLHFGLSVTGSTLLWQFYVDSDFLVIGLLLGPAQLGLYTVAWQFAMMPADRLSGVLNKANIPVFSTLQDNPDGIRRHWHKLMSLVGWTAFPVAAGLALVGGDFIRFALTSKWTGVIPLLPPLCILGAIRAITIILPSLVVALGKPFKLLLNNVVSSIVYPIVFALSAHWGGALAVARAWIPTSLILYLWMISISLPLTPLRLRDYFSSLVAPALTTAIMAASVLAIDAQLPAAALPHLVTKILVGATVYCTLAAFWLWKTDQLSLDRIGLARV